MQQLTDAKQMLPALAPLERVCVFVAAAALAGGYVAAFSAVAGCVGCSPGWPTVSPPPPARSIVCM